jgi:hypothetical protein
LKISISRLLNLGARFWTWTHNMISTFAFSWHAQHPFQLHHSWFNLFLSINFILFFKFLKTPTSCKFDQLMQISIYLFLMVIHETIISSLWNQMEASWLSFHHWGDWIITSVYLICSLVNKLATILSFQNTTSHHCKRRPKISNLCKGLLWL